MGIVSPVPLQWELHVASNSVFDSFYPDWSRSLDGSGAAPGDGSGRADA
jgi:hypothetical protein